MQVGDEELPFPELVRHVAIEMEPTERPLHVRSEAQQLAGSAGSDRRLEKGDDTVGGKDRDESSHEPVQISNQWRADERHNRVELPLEIAEIFEIIQNPGSLVVRGEVISPAAEIKHSARGR